MAFAELDIPDDWTAKILQNMASDYLSGPDSLPLDDATRDRMVGLTIITTIELAAKLAALKRAIEALVEILGEPGDRG